MLPPGFLTHRAAADPGIPGKGTERQSGAGSEAVGERAETSAGANPQATGGCGGLVRGACGGGVGVGRVLSQVEGAELGLGAGGNVWLVTSRPGCWGGG